MVAREVKEFCVCASEQLKASSLAPHGGRPMDGLEVKSPFGHSFQNIVFNV